MNDQQDHGPLIVVAGILAVFGVVMAGVGLAAHRHSRPQPAPLVVPVPVPQPIPYPVPAPQPYKPRPAPCPGPGPCPRHSSCPCGCPEPCCCGATCPSKEKTVPFEKPTVEQLQNRFLHHPPKGDQAARYEAVRNFILCTARECVALTPCCAEQTRALNALDEAMMLFNAAIARNE